MNNAYSTALFRLPRASVVSSFAFNPGVHGKVTKLYYTDDQRVHTNKETQIKTGDLEPFDKIRQSHGLSSSNIYLD